MFRKVAIAASIAAGALVVPVAQASVILLGPAVVQPAGLGTVTTILSLQSQGNATDETARTSYNGTTSVVTTLPNPAGAAQPGVDTTVIPGGTNNQARTFAELGVTQASDLRVFFNINEPTPTNDVLLRNLVFTAYDATGSAVFTASLAAPLTLTQIGPGIGSSSYAFGLDATQAAGLQAVFSSNLRLGLQASLSNAQGGFETFFGGSVTNTNGNGQIPGPNGKVSEPGTLALLGLALAGFGFVWRRKQA